MKKRTHFSKCKFELGDQVRASDGQLGKVVGRVVDPHPQICRDDGQPVQYPVYLLVTPMGGNPYIDKTGLYEEKDLTKIT